MDHPHHLVARAGIRASEQDKARIASDGWVGWVDWQLSFPDAEEQSIADALSQARLNISYDAGDGHGALDEERPFKHLNTQLVDIWHLTDWDQKMAWEERVRPANETLAAIRMRAVLAEAQLREAVADFWRDHFAVNHESAVEVAVGLPTYERMLRQHAFGNFREMLEAVATSTAMLAYLNNASSKASPANENYARELFELHSLGQDAYLNAKFDRWREVPGADTGQPQGYIDQDVYEAARAFTGWTYASGQYVSEGHVLPKTGEFHYLDAWHDPYQKRVLAQEFEPYQAAMTDGRRVLDMAAFHPATARFVAKRLCQRFVADLPSDEMIASTAQVFAENAKSPDQLARTIRHVLLSKDFADSPKRLQRPLFLMASIQRAAGIVLPPNPEHTWMLDGMGQKLYMWHSPAGHPLRSGYWQSPGLLVRRWRMINETWQHIMAHSRGHHWDTISGFALHWAKAHDLDEPHVERAANILRKGFGVDERGVNFGADDRWMTAQALSFLTSTPDFQAV